MTGGVQRKGFSLRGHVTISNVSDFRAFVDLCSGVVRPSPCAPLWWTSVFSSIFGREMDEATLTCNQENLAYMTWGVPLLEDDSWVAVLCTLCTFA